ncbi:MAG: nucleoside kinase [Clostridiales bacterium]|jgi:uridine kinase|nr:nucleoside kinase [Clostridiales bacterium]
MYKSKSGTEIIVNNAGNEPISVKKGASLIEIASLCEAPEGSLAAIVNNKLMDMGDRIYEDSDVRFLDIAHSMGFRVYQRSLVFLTVYGIKAVLGPKTGITVKHSVNKNLYFVLDECQDDDYLVRVESVMRDAVNENLPIRRRAVPPEEAAELLRDFDNDSVIQALNYTRSDIVWVYSLGDYSDRIFGPIAPHAGLLGDFKLVPDGAGFYLQLPKADKSGYMDIAVLNKIRRVFDETAKWAGIIGVDGAGALNKAVCRGRGGDIIRVNEALHENRFAQIADGIVYNAENKKKSVVLVAGPSSSGKTTFASRLCVQLRVMGIRPHVISLDNYFHSRTVVPLDELGEPDFESFDFVDRDLLNSDLERLLAGDRVEIPSYNFKLGEREYKGDTLRLGENDGLVIEGIHALNGLLTQSVPECNKFKIFISALTQINIDRHNRMPMSDARLLRRIVRDMRTRGHDAAKTLAMWDSVTRGEAKNIFPFQEDADMIFNSALVYELCILKAYVEPLLFGIGPNHPSHAVARRLLAYLDSFVAMPPDEVPNNSILREFIGGSCFDV